MRSLLLLFSLLTSTTALPFWLSGWGGSEINEDFEMTEQSEMAEEPEMTEGPEMTEESVSTEEPEIAEEADERTFWLTGWGDSQINENSEIAEQTEMTEEEPEMTEEPEIAEEADDRMEKWNTFKVPCGVLGTLACPEGVNPSQSPTTTTEAPSAGILGLEIPLTGIVLREGSVEATEKLKPIAVPCGLFPLPDCPANVNPSQGATATSTEAPEDSWWPQGRKANVDLKWNKLEMPCGVLGAPACPEGVNQ